MDAGFFLFYVAPRLVLGVLWIRIRIQSPAPATWVMRGLDLAVLLLSAVRLFGTAVPLSGHALFLTYSGLTTPVRWYQAVAVLLFVETAALKLLVWGDPDSFYIGLLAALPLTLLYLGLAVWARRRSRGKA
jgi:hypothetical protein